MRWASSVVVALAVVFIAQSVTAKTVTVALDGSGDYTSIADAVLSASPGSTIIVRPGIYHGTVHIQTTGISLEGHGAVIDGDGGDGVWPGIGSRVTGFVITGCDDGIFVTSQVHDVVIAHNTILRNSGEGITLMNELANVIIRDNIIWDNGYGIYNQGGNTLEADHNLVFGNRNEDYHHCVAHATDVSANPRIAAPADGDFQLRTDSPARGRASDGTDLGAPFRGAPVVAERVEQPTVGSTRPQLSIEIFFMDGSGDGALGPNEEASLIVTLRNRGIGPVGVGAAFTVEADLGHAVGARLGTSRVSIPALSPAGEGTASFLILAGPNLTMTAPLAVHIQPSLHPGPPLAAITVEIPTRR